jgi:hypothetical protein
MPESRLAHASRGLQPLTRHLKSGSVRWGCEKNPKPDPFVPDGTLEYKLPSVTVVVVTFGGRHRFHSFLNYTFFSQIYPESKLDLLILDDNSTSDSPLAEYWEKHPRVEYIRVAGEHVIGWKRNLLMRQAKGEIIVQYDDDDFYNKYYVRFMVEYLMKKQHENVKLVKMASWVNYIPDRTIWKNYSGQDTFESVCITFPNNGFAFAWAFYRNVVDACHFKTVAYGEELQFLTCLLDTYGDKAVHQIGDPHSQLLKIDRCDGITSMFALLAEFPPSWGSISAKSMETMYSPESWSAITNFSIAAVDMAKCTGRQLVNKRS